MIYYNNWTRAEIDLDAIEHNLRVIRERLQPGCRVMAMVKADAYGHGAIPVARCLEDAGIDYLGVANLFEAASLRDSGITVPILILGYTPVALTGDLIRYDITQCVPSRDAAERYQAAAAKLGQTLKIHVKLDTGMSRHGILCHGRVEEAVEEVLSIHRLENLALEGIFTHFAYADSEEDGPTMAQLADFEAVLEKIEARGIKNAVKHCANSAAMLQYSCTHFDMVRLGLALYGLEPVPGVPYGNLKPAMTMKTPITQLKTIPAGTPVSYGMTYHAARETRVATVPVGYGDGYLRSFAGAAMTVCGKPAPVIGRICMDLCMLDVTDIPEVREGDTAVIFGAAPHTTPDDLARLAGTISWEVITGISKRVLRLYLRDGKIVSRLSYI
ncbi:MAG: alanine racemase [Ruminococcaceae bacterium]|nr:alanine racemase [Oscillospiraceae bacterium]